MSGGLPQSAAVIGAGISGLAAAWDLALAGVRVTLFEKSTRLGGHTHTHRIRESERDVDIDSGFIVFNRDNYPLFSRWLDDLDIASHDTNMSFAVRDDRSGIEYGTRSLSGIVGQPLQLLRPGYVRMWRDVVRFYRELGDGEVPAQTVGEYLLSGRYSNAFAESHLLPMCAALWSQTASATADISLTHAVEFMRNHKMLQLLDRPEWRVVTGGSSQYLSRFERLFEGDILLGCKDLVVERRDGSAQVSTNGTRRSFDVVVLACHADQALRVLHGPTRLEQEILSAFPFQANEVFLHSDPSFMPRDKRCWSSWNVVRDTTGEFTTTYWMNLLQGLDTERDYFVTLNPARRPDDWHWRGTYQHPHFGHASTLAQKRWEELADSGNTYFAGAYWGAGFHEDGFASGKRCAEAICGRVARAA